MNWYPNNPGGSFGEYASYDMTFRIPKGMQIAATGARVSENNDGGQNVTVWKSEAPQTVAGFSFGRFKVEEGKLDKPEYDVQSFANQESPSWVQALQHEASGDDLPTMGSHTSGVALGYDEHHRPQQEIPRRRRTRSATLHRLLSAPPYSSICNSPSRLRAILVSPGPSSSGFRSATTSIPPFVINLEWTGATGVTGKL